MPIESPTSDESTTHYVYAPVVRVEAIPLPHQSCPPPERRPVVRLLGGVLGGLVGSQLGGGRGRAALTVVGAVAGAALAGRAHRPPLECRRVDAAGAYRVWYRYHGQAFSKRVSERPGEHVLVAVDVVPLAESSNENRNDQ